MAVTDIHAHFIPADMIVAARDGSGPSGLSVEADDGTELLVHREGYRYPISPVFHDPSARLAAMDQLGIDAAVVSASPTIYFYWLDPGPGAALAQRTNDALARHVEAAPSRLAGLATLPMQDPQAAAAELERAVGVLGMVGAAIGPVVGERPLDDPRFTVVFETAQALDVPLLLHPYYVGLRPGLPDFYLTNLVGNPLETTVSVSRLILSGMLDRLPGLRLALVHAGGFTPYQVGRLDHGWEVRPESKGCLAPPSSYLRRFVYDTLTHSPAALAYLVGLVGADRVAFGTDMPFDMMDGSLDAQLGGTQLAPDDREMVASGTAEAWFRTTFTTGERAALPRSVEV
jgi:aminocarboxymuconate-semialdehyde decarboxylase